MKSFALRDEDLEDIEQMAPMAEEIGFVRNQLDRIARTRPDRALKMQLYLDQGETRHRVKASRTSDAPRTSRSGDR